MLDREVFEKAVKKLKNGAVIEEFEHQGYKLNNKKEHVNMIIEGVNAKGGCCPCKVGKEERNICPCEDFINTGKCCCKLWVKK